MESQIDEIRIKNTMFMSVLRIILTITVVVAAYDTGRAILSFIELVRKPGMHVLLVLLWLLTAPLTFAAAVCLFYAYKRLTEGANVTMPVTIGFGLMILSSVSNLISQSSILNGNGLSIMILCGIVLVCYIICFMYYQRIGSRPLTIFAAGMGVLCGGYYIIQGAILIADEPEQILGYLFTSYMTTLMIALSTFFFVITVGFGPKIYDKDEAK